MYIEYCVLEGRVPEWRVDSLTVSYGASSSYSLGARVVVVKWVTPSPTLNYNVCYQYQIKEVIELLKF